MSDTNTVLVETNRGIIPFSTGYLAKSLLAIGISEDRAYNDATKIAMEIQELGIEQCSSEEIMTITANWYEEREPELAKRIHVIRDDLKAIRPAVILLGGVTGIGKSTIAGLFASRMGIRSILGTDLIREVMRLAISPHLVPTLHTSSYLAHTKLNTSFQPAMPNHIVGFEEQGRAVIVGVEAAIEQAIKENDFVIIEGVHLIPGLINKKFLNNPKVISIQLYLEDKEIHRSRLKLRSAGTESRGTKYIDYYNEIREIQRYLLKEARKHKIPTIEVESNEQALLDIINHVWDNLLI